MALEKICSIVGSGVNVPGDDTDTDRIIPARYLKCVTFDGLGEYAFQDERFDSQGNAKPHPFNDPRFAGASVLLSGSNFGCGSSREHAPQSLYRFGIRGIIAESYADIFFGNSIQLGMPCLCASKGDIAAIVAVIVENPRVVLSIDLSAMSVATEGRTFAVTMPEGARRSLVEGMWDPIAELLEKEAAIDGVAEALGYALRP
jgi:3-isopropylmalate/(R)-2-methylmalate dehydratase small subunit